MSINPIQDFSIIIPTYKEAKNIPVLIERISNIHFNHRLFEVILMDDNSKDGTVEVVEELRRHYPWLRLIVRQGPRGLSLSVMDGFSNAKYPIYVVMDADLSHPPEKIPDMLSALESNADIVIGSRYVSGGSIDEVWSLSRQFISRTSAWLIRSLLALPVKDPLSGFIAVKRDTLLAGDALYPIGWKIGLEMMVKLNSKNIREVPIYFSERTLGKSKLNVKIGLEYVIHVTRLMQYRLQNRVVTKK